MKSTSIVIPCFNESRAIESTIRDIFSHLKKHENQCTDVIVINDGSKDGSKELLDQLAADLQSEPFRVVHHSRNLGYGAALKTGIRRSNADLICITDADGTYPDKFRPHR